MILPGVNSRYILPRLHSRVNRLVFPRPFQTTEAGAVVAVHGPDALPVSLLSAPRQNRPRHVVGEEQGRDEFEP